MFRRISFLVSCTVVVVACSSGDADDGSGSTGAGSTDAAEASEVAASADSEPQDEPTEPTPGETVSTPEPNTTSESIVTVGLVPLPGAVDDLRGVQATNPSVVWSQYLGADGGGVVVENIGGPLPPGCHGAAFIDPDTFDVLAVDGVSGEAYATVGDGGCDGIVDPVPDTIDGPVVVRNDGDIVVFDFGALPPEPYSITNEVLNPDGLSGVFRATAAGSPQPLNELGDATHAVGAAGLYEIDPADGIFRPAEQPTTEPVANCGEFGYCMAGRFGVDPLSPSGGFANPVVLGPSSGLFDFDGDPVAEVLAAVVNGCDLNGHFWVYAAPVAASGFELVVTDTMSGEVRNYDADGAGADPILDVEAFATCP